MKENNISKETILLHYGQSIDNTKSRAIPIYQTTSFLFEDIKHAKDLFNFKKDGFIYTRIQNPTTQILEKRYIKYLN